MIRNLSLALQKGLKSEYLQYVVKHGDNTTLLFRHPKTNGIVVKNFNIGGVTTAGYKPGVRTDKIIKDFDICDNLKERPHLLPSCHIPDKLVHLENFLDETYVATKGKLATYSGGNKIAERTEDMEKVINTFWA